MSDKRSEVFNSLSESSKERYLEKIAIVDNKDPYCLKMDEPLPEHFPQILYPDIVEYFVYKKSSYTSEEFKSYKSLEAYNMFVCGWVRSLKVKKVNDYIIVRGQVLHSQRLSSKPLNPWLICKILGEIVSAHCDCVAGLGETCSHVAAVAFAVDSIVRNIEAVSVTGTKAYWAPPSTSAGTMAKVKKIKFDKKATHTNDDDNETVRFDIPPLDGKEMDEFLGQMKEIGSCALHFVVEPFASEFAAMNDEIVLYSNLFNEENLSKSSEELRSISVDVDLHVSNEDCLKIELETRKQNKSSKWFSYRAGRITASNFKAVCKTRIENPSVSLIKRICYPKRAVFTSKYTIYGCEHEKEALNNYKQGMKTTHTNFAISKVGLIIDQECPYLGASPDALVSCDCCGEGCVEVKCPYCAQETSFEELAESKTFCLKNSLNQLTLDKNHSYFYQVQMQIAVSKKQFCDFIVWSQNQHFQERVYLDKIFWETEKQKATQFFFKVLMPELLGKYFTLVKTSSRSTELDKQTWCICKKPDDGTPMICCDNPNCKFQSYHMDCIEMTSVPEERWSCNACTKLAP